MISKIIGCNSQIKDTHCQSKQVKWQGFRLRKRPSHPQTQDLHRGGRVGAMKQRRKQLVGFGMLQSLRISFQRHDS